MLDQKGEERGSTDKERSFAPKFTNKSSTLSVFGFIGLSSRDLSYFTRSSNKFVNFLAVNEASS